jgi:hypothetical protein
MTIGSFPQLDLVIALRRKASLSIWPSHARAEF